MSQNILLFGGTFDPLHFGHIALLKNAAALVKPDKILIIPASLPPHKKSAEVSAQVRAQMCEVMCNNFDNAIVEMCELNRIGRSYTADTVKYLMQNYENSKFYFCMGSDMLLYFTKWKEYKFLLQNLCLVVQLRQNEDKQNVIIESQKLVAEGGEILLCDGDVLELSSTYIRELIKKNEDLTSFLPKEIIELVKSHNLYTNEV